MTDKVTVVGRTGHMDGDEVVTDSVTVQVVDDDGVVGEATAADEETATKKAKENIEERKAESERRKSDAELAKRMFIEEIRRG